MKLLAPVLLLLNVSTSLAQSKANYGFTSGVIHLINGDSIVGYVEKQVAYGQKLAYKTSENGNTVEIPVQQVNYFKAGNKIFGVIALDNYPILMEMIITSKVALYEYNEIKYGASRRDKNTGLKTIKGDIIIHYVLKLPTAVKEIKEPDFKVVLKQLFADCERMGDKISRGDYLFEDMPQIVMDYNNCKGQYCTHALQPGQEETLVFILLPM